MKKMFLIFTVLFIAICSCGGNDYTNKDYVNRYNKICIEGHVYYRQAFGKYAVLAPKINDDGTPTKCDKGAR
jgi:hypothetical protein